ncbi:putative glutathione S-transferase family protein [Zea mays]|uniref:Glutathione S-transferase family protein n=1 Tax=Zea mays TaxID=4577 RepID=B4FQK3_MAIZE|nr:putative glutathione S-transferase family protein [Zea mays]ACF84396.1 unknown [Zea mays]AQK55488.1 Glutathione S-transferase family protein [Zea mays]|eukprot:NP_001140698.1 putative glutathione S-transferase family protein [Zea mays]
MWATSPPPLPLQLRRPPHPRFIARRRNKRLDRIAASQDPLTALTRVLWGGALPPAQLVVAVRHGWTTAWQLLMRQLAPSDPATGGFARAPARFPAVVGKPSSRLHLYVGLPCPWAHRALVVRALLGLEARLPVSVAVPGDDGAWSFTPGSPDLLYGKRKLREVYALRGGGFEGRASVPMLWDAERCEVVCNESIEIVKFLCDLAGDGAGDLDLWPPELRQDIDRWYSIIYPSVNNGVYRCGFAQSQEAYDAAASELFGALDRLEAHLAGCRYLCGDRLTLADVCLFTTLIRFDLVYNTLFRCTRRKLAEYPSLHAYTRDIYQMPKVAETCDMEAIMAGYFKTLFPLNPGGIQPHPPATCDRESLLRPHGREALSSAAGTPLEAAAVS